MKINQNEKKSILYITYDGLLEPLGQSQVLSYLLELKSNFMIYIISFEKSSYKTQNEFVELKKSLNETGINWIPLQYHKRFSVLATFFDVLSAIVLGVGLIKKNRIALIHARSYVPELIAVILKKITKVPVLFDIRGFWIDERIERGIWPSKFFLIPLFRKIERYLYRKANVINTLTYKSVPEIKKIVGNNVPITVIPTCTDLNTFTLKGNRSSRQLTIGYSGSVDTAYLFIPIVQWVLAIAKSVPSVRFLILSKTPKEKVLQNLFKLQNDRIEVEIHDVPHGEMHMWLKQMDLSIYFLKTGLSSSATNPTKLGELMSSGVPVITNSGVGDIKDILNSSKVGIIVDPLIEPDEKLIDKVLTLVYDESTPGRCRKVAEERFSKRQGVKTYANVYRDLSDL